MSRQLLARMGLVWLPWGIPKIHLQVSGCFFCFCYDLHENLGNKGSEEQPNLERTSFLPALERTKALKCITMLSVAPPSAGATASNRFAPFSLDCPSRSRHHRTASMEPVQLTTAVMTIVNTSRIIVQFMQNQHLKNQSRRRRQRSYEDMNTLFSKTAFPLQFGDHGVNGAGSCHGTPILGSGNKHRLVGPHSVAEYQYLNRKNTKMRAVLTVHKQVAIALWKLTTPASYRSVRNQFGVGKSTVGAAVMQAGNAITELLSKVVTLGNVQVIVDGFAAMGFPNCGGAIDGTHIPLLGPDHQGSQYINRKGYFSMVLQALVDHKGRFTNINVGWPGKVHDAHVFRNSGLFKQLQEGIYFPDQKTTVGDVEMSIVILGDPAYPLMPWLMKPHTGTLESSQEMFNYRLNKCRMVVVCTFWTFIGSLAQFTDSLRPQPNQYSHCYCCLLCAPQSL
ncbi:unnamed protein product [Eretmochelys imbricata]